MVTSRMEPSSSVTRARAALVNVDELLFGLLLVGVSGSAGGADGLISAGIVCVAQLSSATRKQFAVLHSKLA